MLIIFFASARLCRGHASENPDLPASLAEHGIRFLGPPSVAMAALGDKVGSGAALPRFGSSAEVCRCLSGVLISALDSCALRVLVIIQLRAGHIAFGPSTFSHSSRCPTGAVCDQLLSMRHADPSSLGFPADWLHDSCPGRRSAHPAVERYRRGGVIYGLRRRHPGGDVQAGALQGSYLTRRLL